MCTPSNLSLSLAFSRHKDVVMNWWWKDEDYSVCYSYWICTHTITAEPCQKMQRQLSASLSNKRTTDCQILAGGGSQHNYHTLAQCQSVLRMTAEVNGINGNGGKFDPRSSKNPWTDGHQTWHGNDVGDPYLYAKFHHDLIRGFCSPPLHASAHTCAYKVTRLVNFSGGSSSSLQPRPLHRSLWSILQMTLFCWRMCLLGVPKTKFYISTPIFPQNR